MKKTSLSSAGLLAVSLLGAASPMTAAAQKFTRVEPMARATWQHDYVVEPVLSVGDKVPRASNTAQQYQMVGIPDGLGAYALSSTRMALQMNHELGFTTQSEPVVGQPLHRGAFVSRYVLRTSDRAIMTGDVAYSEVWNGQTNTLEGPTPRTDNATAAFSRFCSSYQAGPHNGLDRWIYFTGEEGGGSGTHDGMGGIAVAIMDDKLYTMPAMGRYPKENVLAMPAISGPGYAGKTVIILTEDGPATAPYSGVFMWVGTRNAASTNVMEKNGLVNGTLYYLRSTDADRNSELDFGTYPGDSVTCEWVEAPNALTQTEGDLKTELVSNNFFRFSRPEDGAFNPAFPRNFAFVTTGEDPAGNALGRIYQLEMNPADPTLEPELVLIHDANDNIYPDGPVSPDNVGFADGLLMVQEDGTGTSRPVMAARKRNPSVWMFDSARFFPRPERVAEATEITRDGILAQRGTAISTTQGWNVTQRGIWETTGIIPFMHGSTTYWFQAVQAHSPTTTAFPNTVEEGQIVVMFER